MYNSAIDPSVPASMRPFRGTADDPLCDRCGWPKHHHHHGIGGLAYQATTDRCDEFVWPKGTPMRQLQEFGTVIEVRTPATGPVAPRWMAPATEPVAVVEPVAPATEPVAVVEPTAPATEPVAVMEPVAPATEPVANG